MLARVCVAILPLSIHLSSSPFSMLLCYMLHVTGSMFRSCTSRVVNTFIFNCSFFELNRIQVCTTQPILRITFHGVDRCISVLRVLQGRIASSAIVFWGRLNCTCSIARATIVRLYHLDREPGCALTHLLIRYIPGVNESRRFVSRMPPYRM